MGRHVSTSKSARRMPLHQLLAHTEKQNRDIVDFLHTEFHVKVSELRELTETLLAGGHLPAKSLQNALAHLESSGDQLLTLLSGFTEALEVIHDHASRDRVERQK
jgi:hypothetical protein